VTLPATVATPSSPSLLGPDRLQSLSWLPPVLAVAAVALLVTVPFPGSILLCGAGAIGIVAALSPAWAVTLLTASLALNNVLAWDAGGTTITLPYALVIGVVVGWALRVFALREPLRQSPIAWPLAACVLAGLFSVVAASDLAAWSNEIQVWVNGLAIFVVATQAIRTPTQVWRIVAVMAGCTVALAGYALWQVVEDMGPSSYEVGGLLRAYATFGGPNSFAKYLEMTVPLLAAISGAWLVAVTPWLRDRVPLIARSIPWWVGGLATVATAAGGLALILTQSRGGWIGAALGLAVVALLLGGVYRWTFIIATFAIVLLAILTPVGDRVALRFGSEALGISTSSTPVNVTPANWAVQERLAHYRAGLHMVEENPWLGVGAGNFDARYREYTEVWRFRIPRSHAHNAYIQVAAQSGLVGLGAYLALIVTITIRLRSRWRAVRGSDRIIVIGAIGVSVAVATHNLFDYLHVGVLPIQLSIVWALAERVRRGQAEPADSGQEQEQVSA